MTAVELPADQLVPPVLAGAIGARQTEDQCALGETGAGAALHGGKAYALEADHVPDRLKTLDGLVEQRTRSFRGDVTASKTGPTSADNNFHLRIGDPTFELRLNLPDIVPDQGTSRQNMTITR